MDQLGYRVTTNFHEIKAWMDSHNAFPSVTTKDNHLYPEIVNENTDGERHHETSLAQFFTAMLNRNLAFRYKNEWYEFVNQEDYSEQIEDLR